MKRQFTAFLLLGGLIPLSLFLSCSRNSTESDAYGNFEVTDIMVSPEISGMIVRFPALEGQVYEEGSILAIIDTTDLILKREALQAQIRSLQSKLEGIKAQVEVQLQQKENILVEKERLNRLIQDKAATVKQMDDLKGSLSVIEKQVSATSLQKGSVLAEMDALGKQLDQVTQNIRKCYILNPVKGTLLEKYAEAGEVGGAGKPICKMADLSVVYLRVYLSGEQLASVKLGQAVDVMVDKDSKTNRKLKGSISWVSPNAEFTPKTIQTKEERVNLVYAAKIRVENDGSLKINMPGEIKF